MPGFPTASNVADESGTVAAAPATAPLLRVDRLDVDVLGDAGAVRLVDGVSFELAAGEVLGLVGESGCGKSVTALSLLRLLPEPPIRVQAERVGFEELDLARLSRSRLREVRGSRIGMIFQEPMTSLNPTFTVGWQIDEALRLHTKLGRAARRGRALELLRHIGVGAPEQRLAQYPHELSGGLRQRMMIAVALACAPRLLIADEPTTALDVTVQLQILQLIDRLRREDGMAVLLITHDLGVISALADRVVVMYSGRIVETGATARLLSTPRHPYTAALLQARPHLHGPRGELRAIAGTVPSPAARPAGCAFAPRCTQALPRCARDVPLLDAAAHAVACWNPVA
jgi:oligopeptide/dipeptide ABC transporter ATP-binding protein